MGEIINIKSLPYMGTPEDEILKEVRESADPECPMIVALLQYCCEGLNEMLESSSEETESDEVTAVRALQRIFRTAIEPIRDFDPVAYNETIEFLSNRLEKPQSEE